MAAAKNPKLMAIAAMGNDSRVIHFQFTDNEEQSVKIWATSARITKTPAWACPARNIDF